MKTCPKCGAAKTAREFRKDQSTKDGLHSWCTPCKKISEDTWRARNPERKRLSVLIWARNKAAEKRGEMPLIKRRGRKIESMARGVTKRVSYVETCPFHLHRLISPADPLYGAPAAKCPLKSCAYRVEPWQPLTRWIGENNLTVRKLLDKILT